MSSDGRGDRDLGKAAAHQLGEVELLVFGEVELSAPTARKPKKRDSIDQGLANPLGAAPERYVFASSKTIKWFLTSHPEGLVNILGHQLVPLSVVHELLTVLYQLANPGKNIPLPYNYKHLKIPVGCFLCQLSRRLLWQKTHANGFCHHLVERK